MAWLIVAALLVKVVGLAVLGYLIFRDPLERFSPPHRH